jgi:hypothetical protein
MWQVKERSETYIEFWSGSVRRDHMGDLDVDGSKIAKIIFKKQPVRTGSGFSWLRVVSNSSLYQHGN